ncbi:MAG: AraC family transcriptional regulator [Spirochaetaceae bacterium]|nr:MAG: AraC family transcriptional regulator [Spirochaetaceae bacterium]
MQTPRSRKHQRPGADAVRIPSHQGHRQARRLSIAAKGSAEPGNRAPWHERRAIDARFPVRCWRGNIHGFPLHWHELVEACLVESGSLAVFVDGRRIVLSAGEMVLIGPQRIHGYEGLGETRATTMLQFSLDEVSLPAGHVSDDPSISSVYSGLRILRPSPGAPANRKSATDSNPAHRIVSCVRDISREFTDLQPGYRSAVRARLLDLTVILLRAEDDAELTHETHRGAADIRRHETLERVFSYVQEHAEEPISLDDAAAAASMSRSHFSRFFHRETGRTFQQYLARLRVSRAEQMLYQTDLTIQEIALRSGFGASSTFNRLFRRYTGRNPRSCRRG